MPELNAVTALLQVIQGILTRHSVRAAWIEPGTKDTWIVQCQCRAKFKAGEAHAIHQARVVKGWMVSQAAGYGATMNGRRELT